MNYPRNRNAKAKGQLKSLYRIFTNDRGKARGVPLYSCLKELMATSPEEARKKTPAQFDAPNFAPAVAIHWPESAQSEDEKYWLRKHVGKGL